MAFSQSRHRSLHGDPESFTSDAGGQYMQLTNAEKVAEMLDLSERTVASLTSSGALPSIKIGHARRYRVDEIRAWIKVGAPTTPGAGDAIRAMVDGGAA